jgi:hypothetical protein
MRGASFVSGNFLREHNGRNRKTWRTKFRRGSQGKCGLERNFRYAARTRQGQPGFHIKCAVSNGIFRSGTVHPALVKHSANNSEEFHMVKLGHLLATVALGAGLAAALPALPSQAAQAFLHPRGGNNGGGHATAPRAGGGHVGGGHFSGGHFAGGHFPAGGHWTHTWHGGHYGWWYAGPGFWYADPYAYYGYDYGYPYPYPDPAYGYPPDGYGAPDGYGPPEGYGPPAAYSEQGDDDDYGPDADDQGPPQQQSWYYCDASRTYYPYVKSCDSGWRAVPAQAQPPQAQASRPPANTQR